MGDVVVPSAKAALAVGTGVAPWVGAADDDHLIKIDPGKLTTLKFKPHLADKAVALANAEKTTGRYLDSLSWVNARGVTNQDLCIADDHSARQTLVREPWLYRLTARQGFTGPLALAALATITIACAGLLVIGAIVLLTAFLPLARELSPRSWSTDNWNLWFRNYCYLIITANIFSGLLLIATFCARSFCKLAANWHHSVSRNAASTSIVRRSPAAAVAPLAALCAISLGVLYVSVRHDITGFYDLTTEVTVTGVSAPSPNTFEHYRDSGRDMDFRYSFESTDPRIPPGQRTFSSVRLYYPGDRVRLIVEISENGRVDVFENPTVLSPWSPALLGLAIVSGLCAFWSYRILHRGPALIRV